MISKDELIKIGVYFAAAITATVIKFLREEKKSFSFFMAEMLIGASFAFFIIPAAVEHFKLSFYVGTAITWLVTMFSQPVLKKLESKLTKKIEDDVPNIDN